MRAHWSSPRSTVWAIRFSSCYAWQMRRLSLLVAIAFAGCGSSKAKGPAWPAPSTTAEDGGESIAPQPSATYAAAIEKSAEPDEAKPADATAGATTTTPTEDKPATTPTLSQPTI